MHHQAVNGILVRPSPYVCFLVDAFRIVQRKVAVVAAERNALVDRGVPYPPFVESLAGLGR
jgi:hypothetical protein